MEWANVVGKNAARRHARHRVATNFQFAKNAASAKHNKAKCNKTRSAYNQFSKLNLVFEIRNAVSVFLT